MTGRGALSTRRILGVLGGILLTSSMIQPAAAARTAPTPIADLPELPAIEALYTSAPTATVVQYSLRAGEYQGPNGERIAVRTSATYTCLLSVDSPHWSTGAQSVIAKPRVQCKGPTSKIPMRVVSLLARSSTNSIPALRPVATSDYVLTVTVNSTVTWGPRQTWYVPAQNSPVKIGRGAFFRGAASASPSAPLLPFSVPGAASAFIWVG